MSSQDKLRDMLAQQKEAQRQAEQRRRDEERQYQTNREQRRLAEEARQRAETEAKRIESERGAAYMKRLGVESELRGIRNEVGGRVENNGRQAALVFNEREHAYGTLGPRKYQTIDMESDQVNVRVNYDANHQPVSLNVNGTTVRTREELETALARSAMNPNRVTERIQDQPHSADSGVNGPNKCGWPV